SNRKFWQTRQLVCLGFSLNSVRRLSDADRGTLSDWAREQVVARRTSSLNKSLMTSQHLVLRWALSTWNRLLRKRAGVLRVRSRASVSTFRVMVGPKKISKTRGRP